MAPDYSLTCFPKEAQMIPIGPLMREHRLIERVLKLMKGELQRIRETNRVDPVFIEAATDFM
jgi:hypothetical protein